MWLRVAQPIEVYIIRRGTQKILEFIYKKLCIYSYMFKLHSPSKCSAFDARHLSRHSFHHSKQFLNSSILMPSVLLLFFVSPLPHQQNSSLWGIFSSGETLSMVWAGALIGHPSWNGQMIERVKKKKFTEAELSLSQQCCLIPWYRWIPTTLI